MCLVAEAGWPSHRNLIIQNSAVSRGSRHRLWPLSLQLEHFQTSDQCEIFRAAEIGPPESVQPFISPNFWWKVQFNQVFSISSTVKSFSRNLTLVSPTRMAAATALATGSSVSVDRSTGPRGSLKCPEAVYQGRKWITTFVSGKPAACPRSVCVGDTEVKFRERPFTVMKYLFWYLIH